MIDHPIYTLGIIIATMLVAYVILWSGLQTFNANPSKRFMRIWPKLALYHAAYTMPIWALLLIAGWATNVTPMLGQSSLLWILLCIAVMGLYFYTVIVQPSRLRLRRQTIDLGLTTPLTVAVLADLRIGLYSGKPRHIRKLIATINELTVDAVLITGDWLYYPSADLVGQLMLFKGANKPIYTVMSISDLRYQSMNTTKQGQPLLEDTLACAFDVLDIACIGQKCLPLPPKSTGNVHTYAIKDRQDISLSTKTTKRIDPVQQTAMLCGWQDVPKHYLKNTLKNIGSQEYQKQVPAAPQADSCTNSHENNHLKKHSHETNAGIAVLADKTALRTKIKQATLPVIILAARFDNVADLPKALQPRPLLIAGAAKSAEFKGKLTGNERGLYQHGSAQVFVSSGIGTRGLPFRLHCPTIDVLTIR
ncbi:hypothetical protein [uncultured Psychrobacter sp.]|uniref:hypothetical protein n=1 Tax=uncultured Psychrobacter sp. TaxID=259303 RepID=UPI00345996CC